MNWDTSWRHDSQGWRCSSSVSVFHPNCSEYSPIRREQSTHSMHSPSEDSYGSSEKIRWVWNLSIQMPSRQSHGDHALLFSWQEWGWIFSWLSVSFLDFSPLVLLLLLRIFSQRKTIILVSFHLQMRPSRVDISLLLVSNSLLSQEVSPHMHEYAQGISSYPWMIRYCIVLKISWERSGRIRNWIWCSKEQERIEPYQFFPRMEKSEAILAINISQWIHNSSFNTLSLMLSRVLWMRHMFSRIWLSMSSERRSKIS